MIWRLEPLPLDGPIFDGAIAVYAEAFARAPYFDDDRGEDVRRRLIGYEWLRPGYNGVVALTDAGEVGGLGYAYTGCPGQWWYDTVASQLDRSTKQRWMSDCCELVELAVAPELQGKGVGRLLMERLLSTRTEQTCVLSTHSQSSAVGFYSLLGFETIREMKFAANGADFTIMGKGLQTA